MHILGDSHFGPDLQHRRIRHAFRDFKSLILFCAMRFVWGKVVHTCRTAEISDLKSENQYLMRGSINVYEISTRRLKTKTVTAMKATMPMIKGSSRFRHALMK